MIKDLNKLEQLEQKVQDLERKLEEKTSLEDAVREMEKRLNVYEEKIRSDKGEINLKKNFVIKNRKGKIPGRSDNEDNVITMYFNDIKTGDLNHIYMGTAAADGYFNNSVFSGFVTRKENAPNILNNGTIQFSLIRDEDIDSEGRLKPTLRTEPNISIYAQEIDGTSAEGDSINIVSRREGGRAYLYHINETTGDYNRIVVDRDGFWKETGNFVSGDITKTAL